MCNFINNFPSLPIVWLVSLLFLQCMNTVSGEKIFCYYSSFAQTRQGPGNFLPEDIDPHLCTHIIFAFVDITPDGRDLAPFNRNDQGPHGLYARTLALKEENPSLKVLLAVGGWQIGSKPFIPMVRTEENRRIWVANVVDYLRRHGFDGFDVDWEFPATRGSPADDKFRFTLLMKELYEAFAEDSVATGREKLILTMATASGTYYISQSYEPHKIVHYLDYMLLMTYNYHGQWEKTTGHHSGLYPHGTDPKYGEKAQLYQEWSIDYWLEVGIPKEKLIVGIPTYAMTFTLADQSQTDVGAPVTGGGRMGKYTRETGIMAYYEICENLQENGWDSVWIEEQAVPYAYGQDQWAGYENVHSVTLKAKNIVARGLAGAFVWSVEMGDYRGTCGDGPYPLLKAIHGVIGPGYGVKSISPHHENSRLRHESSVHTTASPPSSLHQHPPRPNRKQHSRVRAMSKVGRRKMKRIKHRRNWGVSSSSAAAAARGVWVNRGGEASTASVEGEVRGGGEGGGRGEGGMSEGTPTPEILTTRVWYRTGARHRHGKWRRKWKKKPRNNDVAAARTIWTGPDGYGRNDVHYGEDYWQVPESKWWPGLLYEEDHGRINARATGRPRYIPVGHSTDIHLTTEPTHAQQSETDWLAVSTEASASAAISKNYCHDLGVGTFAHPKSCDRFIICLPGSWRKYPPHVMACPVGTRFDINLKICNYATLVNC